MKELMGVLSAIAGRTASWHPEIGLKYHLNQDGYSPHPKDQEIYSKKV